MNSLSANSRPLRAGVLAAGRGERLRGQTNQLKPLVKVDGQTLIERVLNSMAEAGATEVIVIINEDSVAVRDHVAAAGRWPFSLRWIVETTPTSMHSFLRLVETLAANGDEGPFLLSTVDTVAGALTYARFITEARQLQEAAVTLALGSVGDDEKPLLVRTAPGDSRIVALGEMAAPSAYATAGIYAVRASILNEAEAARRDGIDALRTFLGRLLDRGYHLAGIPIAQSIDVDRPGDIRIAEEFLRSTAV
jgi:NDP-sugar pyrophosphorylase family protein